MMTIDKLKNFPEAIPTLANIFYEVLGKKYFPDYSIEEIQAWYDDWLNETIPLAYVALVDGEPVGSCSLQLYDGIRKDLGPWLGDLTIDARYQRQGIGKRLIEAVKQHAKKCHFDHLYLFTFDAKLQSYYEKLGWRLIGEDRYDGHPVIVMSIML